MTKKRVHNPYSLLTITPMISDDFYRRYQLFLSSNPLFPRYIRRVYKKTLDDFALAGMAFNTQQQPFTALLCGTCGEITSGIFVEHILALNRNAHIIILDYGDAQITHSKEAISKLFPEADVSYVVSDARQSGIASASVDFIDTDFMFEYLDADGLDQLFLAWKRILAPGGHIAFRAFGTRSWLSRFFYTLLIRWPCKLMLKSDMYSHSLEFIENVMKKHGFRYTIAGKAFLPFGYRFVVRG